MTDNSYVNPVQDEFDEESIDWARYLSAFLKNWRKIAIATFCFAVLSVVIALCQKRQYTVSVTLAPEVQGNARGAGSLGSIASMFGVNLNSASASADALNITIFPQIASSTPFLSNLFEVELTPLPVLPKDPMEARNIMEGPLPSVILFDYLTHRTEEKSFLTRLKESIFGEAEKDPDYLKLDVARLTKEQDLVLRTLRTMISVDVDKKTAITTVNVTMRDPLMCAQLADTVCRRLREYVYDYRTEKQRNDLNYYTALCEDAHKAMVEAQAAYAESMDNNHNVILQKVNVRSQRLQQEAAIASQVYQQMVQQREMARAQLQEVKPVFAIVEPATMPLRPNNSRAKTCIVITFFGFALACGWYIIVEQWLKDNISKLIILKKEMANNNTNV